MPYVVYIVVMSNAGPSAIPAGRKCVNSGLECPGVEGNAGIQARITAQRRGVAASGKAAAPAVHCALITRHVAHM